MSVGHAIGLAYLYAKEDACLSYTLDAPLVDKRDKLR